MLGQNPEYFGFEEELNRALIFTALKLRAKMGASAN